MVECRGAGWGGELIEARGEVREVAGELLHGDAVEHLVVVGAAGVDRAADAALVLEADLLVQLDRGFVEGVDARVRLLVAQLAEVVAQQQLDRLAGVSVAAVLREDRDAVGESPRFASQSCALMTPRNSPDSAPTTW